MDGNVDEKATREFNEALQQPQWDDWLFKDTDRRARLLELNDRFQDQAKKIRAKLEIDPSEYKSQVLDPKKLAANWALKLDEKQKRDWNDYVTYILHKAHLTQGWRISVEVYILTSIFIAPPAILLYSKPDKNGPSTDLHIVINDQVSKTDFDKLYKYIDEWLKYQGYKPKNKRMPYTQIGYYFEMYELKKQGLTNAEISSALGKKYEAKEKTPTFTTKYVREKLKYLEALIDSQMS